MPSFQQSNGFFLYSISENGAIIYKKFPTEGELIGGGWGGCGGLQEQ